ncbi:hypothetical protein NDU88_005363 [Pleurodeles waltl]|uniref:Uncharacterized protein n=1 Tax=Pleurodeles waltl TaxID=8319 RepID=A0AAV7LKX1_PLEWA|nr:hypothetical protein NDU88_005363 [Pleurodeles waltl]
MPLAPMCFTPPLSQHPDPRVCRWPQHLTRPHRDPGDQLRSGPPLASSVGCHSVSDSLICSLRSQGRHGPPPGLKILG